MQEELMASTNAAIISPYQGLPPRAFWRTGVSARDPLDPGDLYTRRFSITKNARIVTAGSCFAQHVGRTLRTSGYAIVDEEALPQAVSDKVAHRYGYRLYSARYGNIYTSRQLFQLLREAYGEFVPAEAVWERDNRYYDAFRPNVEPDGLESEALVREHRAAHLKRVRRAFEGLDVFIFTFGLTETWIHRHSGTVYPTAPGTIAGSFDPALFAFCNLDFHEVLSDFESCRSLIMGNNPGAKFIITVSPVPLTATASGNHIEVATSYSKAVLRAVCGALVERYDNIDYFPSYEVITSQRAGGAYYDSNLRSVTTNGVNTAMKLFLAAHDDAIQVEKFTKISDTLPLNQEEELICEDLFLDRFATSGQTK